MRLTNKFLATLISFVLILSLSFNLIALNEFNKTPIQTQAFATKAYGEVNLDVISALSIEVSDFEINFGSCTINQTRNYSLFDSALNEDQLDNINCENGTYPDYFQIKNCGSVNSNLTIKTSKTGSDFFNDPDAWIAFAGLNLSSVNGCDGILQQEYLNFTQAQIDYEVCNKFTPENQVKISMQAFVTNQSSNGGDLSLVITAFDI